MAEYAPNIKTANKNPDEIEGILPEIVKDVGSVQSEFVASLSAILEDVTDEELAQLGVHRAEEESLRDRYQLPFDPEKTIPKLGDVAMIMTSPDIAKTVLTRESVATIDGEKEERRIKQERIDKEAEERRVREEAASLVNRN